VTSAGTGERRRRSPGFLIGLTLITLLLFPGFGALGVWQVPRLAWKRDLIARVDARIHAAPVPAPRAATRDDESRRVTTNGIFLHDRSALVLASTVRGAGYWVLTPLRHPDGTILMVNRGFVPPDAKTHYDRPNGPVQITGLIRLTEPGGGFLRANNPAADRWYSRDVAAIAAARGLSNAAPYFIDADARPNPDGWPRGGLTVIAFPNSHLVYALTWFGMALLTLVGYGVLARETRRRRSAP